MNSEVVRRPDLLEQYLVALLSVNQALEELLDLRLDVLLGHLPVERNEALVELDELVGHQLVTEREASALERDVQPVGQGKLEHFGRRRTGDGDVVAPCERHSRGVP